MSYAAFCRDFAKHREFELHYLDADGHARCEVCSQSSESSTEVEGDFEANVDRVELVDELLDTSSSAEALRRVFGPARPRR